MLKATPRSKLRTAEAPLVVALVEDDRLLREEVVELRVGLKIQPRN